MEGNSFVNEIANPIVQARLERSVSSNGLAKRLGLSRQYISRAEAGTYANLNPAVIKWTAESLSISARSVYKRYVQFQQAKRQATAEQIQPHKLERHEGNREPSHVLFERWRSSYWPSTVAFSNAFCVHSDTVRNYEEGIRKDMPSAIREALNEVHLLDANFETIRLQGRGSEGPSQSLTARA